MRDKRRNIRLRVDGLRIDGRSQATVTITVCGPNSTFSVRPYRSRYEDVLELSEVVEIVHARCAKVRAIERAQSRRRGAR